MSCELNFFDNLTGDNTGVCPDWTTCLTTMFRVFIDDLGPEYEYSDTRVCQMLNIGAFYVSADLCDCPNLALTVNLTESTVDPDPLSNPVLANLIVLRAICLIDTNVARTRAAFDGIKAVCGPASMSTTGGVSLNALFSHGACKMYQDLKMQCCFRNPVQAASFCRSVLAPFARGCYPPIYREGYSDNYYRENEAC